MSRYWLMKIPIDVHPRECLMNRDFPAFPTQPRMERSGRLGGNLGGSLGWLPMDAVEPPGLCRFGRNKTNWESLRRLLVLICDLGGPILPSTTPATPLHASAPRRVFYCP